MTMVVMSGEMEEDEMLFSYFNTFRWSLLTVSQVDGGGQR